MRHDASDFVDHDAIAAAKARSPHSRQNCQGSMRQLSQLDVAHSHGSIGCPVCGKGFTSYATQRDRAAQRPIVPSHLPDFTGMAKIAQQKAVREQSSTPRPY